MNNHVQRFVWLAFCIVLTIMKAQPQSPKANPSSYIIRGDVRFTILTPQLVRMEWSKDSVFEDRASLVFIDRNLPVPPFSVNETDENLIISTDKLIIRYKKESGRFSSDNLSIRFILNNRTVEWTPGIVDTQNLKGTTRTLDGTDGEKDIQLEQGLLSRAGWSFINDSERPLFDSSEWNWVTPRRPGERQDWYFLGYGHDYKKALYDFTRVAGKIPMPPLFAFGYWWSRYWTYSDAELRQLVADMRRYDVPIDVLIIDMDWHETFGLSVHGTKRDPFGQSVGWTGYTWNKSLFPDPDRFLQWTKTENLRTALNLHPASGIAPMEAQYPAFASKFGFDTTGQKYIPFAIENKKWTQTYFDVILHPLEKQGVDFWWLDWQAWLENRNINGLSNTWWLNYAFFTDMERRGEKRPLLFHRWGGLGNHRYQIGFSGDSWSTWEALAYQPYFTATAANVGYGYWSHDIGGHLGNDPDPELYLRWIQWGVFSPILRTHSTKSSEIERRIWKYPAQFDMMRDAFHLRYALAPYIYTSARKTFDTGVSICHPLYYDYPDAKEAYEFKGQYMFGDDILVAPITKKSDSTSGLAIQKIWLPKGTWFEWFTGSMLKGDSIVERKFSLNEIPAYMRAGAIIPMAPKVSNLQQRLDTLILECIPGANGETRIYEDDGTTSGYKEHEYAFTKVTQEIAPDGSRKIVVFPREGKYKNMPKGRIFEIRLPNTFPPTGVTVDGKSISSDRGAKSGSWSYDAWHLTTRINIPSKTLDKKIGLVVKFSQEDKSDLLDGMKGLFGRLPNILLLMKDEVNRRDQIANAPPLVLSFGSLPMRISYQPDRAAEFIRDFRTHYSATLEQIMNFPRGDEHALEMIVAQYPFPVQMTQKPLVKVEKPVSDKPVRVALNVPEGATARYTLDGTEPTPASTLYDSAFVLDKTATIKAKAFRAGFLNSFTTTDQFQLVYAKSVTYQFPNSPRYTGGGEFALVDGALGSPENYRSSWVGFQQVDVVATIELLAPRDISSISMRFLQDQESWIFTPARLEYEVSSDGKVFTSVYQKEMKQEAESKADDVTVKTFRADVTANKVAFVRVKATNIGICPPWHEGAGGKAWIFTDEVRIE